MVSTPGDAPNVLVAMNAAALKAEPKEPIYFAELMAYVRERKCCRCLHIYATQETVKFRRLPDVARQPTNPAV